MKTGRHEMQTRVIGEPWWAALVVWGVVNAVNVLQAAGFLSRVWTGGMQINHLLGYAIATLALPAAAAAIAFWRAGSSWLEWLGPAAYVAFVFFMVVVEYILQIEFRSPPRGGILATYLLLFFGSILLMGLPMFRLDRRLWMVTVATTILLLASMGWAMKRGVG